MKRGLHGVKFEPPSKDASYGKVALTGLGECGPIFAQSQRVQVCVKKAKGGPGMQLSGPSSVWQLLKGLGHADRESVVMIYLDVGNRVLGIEEVAKGTATSTETTPREIMKSAVLLNASNLVFAHNHPSGSLTPSAADLEFGETLDRACKMMGFRLLDRIIISSEGMYSAAERSMFSKRDL